MWQLSIKFPTCSCRTSTVLLEGGAKGQFRAAIRCSLLLYHKTLLSLWGGSQFTLLCALQVSCPDNRQWLSIQVFNLVTRPGKKANSSQGERERPQINGTAVCDPYICLVVHRSPVRHHIRNVQQCTIYSRGRMRKLYDFHFRHVANMWTFETCTCR